MWRLVLLVLSKAFVRSVKWFGWIVLNNVVDMFVERKCVFGG